MSQTGSSLMSLMQDQSIRKLDLLVREAVQNSLDAGLSNEPNSRVEVDFITGEFNRAQLSEQFPYIRSRLDRRYPQEMYEFIAVRDSHTTGLTGTNRVDDDKSKLQGLIYHICKKQTKEGAGGSWGIGKTTFFRIGIGLVVYYSRTKESGVFVSKLAATLVEDEGNNPLVVVDDSRGISFFGRYENESSSNSIRDITIPINDETMIKDFLDIFGIEPYSGNDTGTTVIMPFTFSRELLRDAKPQHDRDDGRRDPTWTSDVSEYIRISVQRWYAPRINNNNFPGSWLKISINGDPIRRVDMHPLFRLLQELYNVSISQTYKSEFLPKLEKTRSVVKINSVIGQKAGYIGATRVRIADLNLTNEYYRNVYSLIGEYDASLNSPIVTFTRKPGMFIRYVTGDSPWVPKIQNPDDGHVLVCVFSLASDAKLKEPAGSLEEYIRSRERADHNNWDNNPEYNIVKRLSENTGSELKRLFGSNTDIVLDRRSNLSLIFADLFLPHSDMKRGSVSNISSGSKGTNSRRGKSKLTIQSTGFENGMRDVTLQFISGRQGESAYVEFNVSGERGSISPQEWENDFNKPYPITIQSMSIRTISKPKTSEFETINIDKTVNTFEDCHIYFESSDLGSKYGIILSAEKSARTYETVIRVTSSIDTISFEVKTGIRGDE